MVNQSLRVHFTYILTFSKLHTGPWETLQLQVIIRWHNCCSLARNATVFSCRMTCLLLTCCLIFTPNICPGSSQLSQKMATDDYIRENLIERFCIKSYFNHNLLSIHATTAHSSLFSQLHTLPNNSTDSHLDTSAFCLHFHAFIFSPVSGSVSRHLLPFFFFNHLTF